MNPSASPQRRKGGPMVRFTVFFMACLAGCGGGGPTPDESGNNNPGTNPGDNPGNPGYPAVNVEEFGTLAVTVGPEIASTTPFRLELNGEMLEMSVTAGQMVVIEDVEANRAMPFGVKCPGYGYAVVGQHWTTRDEPPDEWTMSVQVAPDEQTAVNATVFRNLAGTWRREGDDPRPLEVSMDSLEDGSGGRTLGLPYQLRVTGDTTTVDASGECPGTPVTLTANEITVDCGFGWVDTFTRLE